MNRVNDCAPPYNAHSALTDADLEVVANAIAILDNAMRIPELMFTEPKVVGDYVRLRLAPHEREVFAVLFMDTRHRLIAYEELFFGTIDGAEIHPREIIKRALHHNAAAIILAHNHPSGDTEPSAADRAVTQRMKQAAALVDVRVLDHFVVGVGRPVSMAARGWV